ncbi:MAG: hypothetical protein HQL95_05685 [Magnetococcales bacterium]|nr:hypothetical protein [Magnetococcales bacterium]
MSDYTPYVTAVYVLAFVILGGYTLRWHASWKKLQRQLDHLDPEAP